MTICNELLDFYQSYYNKWPYALDYVIFKYDYDLEMDSSRSNHKLTPSQNKLVQLTHDPGIEFKIVQLITVKCDTFAVKW